MKHQNPLLLSCRRLWPVAVVIALAVASHLLAAKASARLNQDLTQLPLRQAPTSITPRHIGVPNWEETEVMVAVSEPTFAVEAAPVATMKTMPPRGKHTEAKRQRADLPATREFIPDEPTVEPQPTEYIEQPHQTINAPVDGSHLETGAITPTAALAPVPTPEASALPVRAQNSYTEKASLDTNQEAANPVDSPLPQAEP